jgi:hypothetical protein
MTKTLLTLLAGSTAAVAAPALSQTAETNLSARVDQLQTQIQAGVQAGQITRGEAQPLREQLRSLRQTERAYRVNGYTYAERQQLQTRIRDLRSQIRYAARNDLTRYGAAQWVDVNRDGWDDRDTNRDGVIDTAYAMGNARVPVQCNTPTGVAGILSSFLGQNPCLRVGRLAPANLMAVPYQHRATFRDGNGVYFRTDGRTIYQIDARTNVVTAIYTV